MAEIMSLELRSTLHADGTLTLGIAEAILTPPAEDEVIVQIEAAPINPSDLGLLLASADMQTLTQSGDASRPVVSLQVPPSRMVSLRARIGQPLPVGNEGAGTVVQAGSRAAHLLDRKVGMRGGGMYAQYRKLRAADVVELPAGVTAQDGAAMFVNPLTALSFVEVARREGHTAIVHTAAASSLGQMLQKICLADGISLVNIVRDARQAEILRDIGARWIVDSSAPGFHADLVDAVAATKATIAFDAIGGGSLGGTILNAMEEAASRATSEYSRYGSDIHKQLYVYGTLDRSPTSLDRAALGYRWSVDGFLLTPFLESIGPDAVAAMRLRIRNELLTTFANRYTSVISLHEALHADVIRAYERKATGEKYLINPAK